jgi:hypothetical protein
MGAYWSYPVPVNDKFVIPKLSLLIPEIVPFLEEAHSGFSETKYANYSKELEILLFRAANIRKFARDPYFVKQTKIPNETPNLHDTIYARVYPLMKDKASPADIINMCRKFESIYNDYLNGILN